MKRVRRRLECHLRPLRLYLEDLEQLREHLTMEEGTSEVAFCTEDREYDSLEEMSKNEAGPLRRATIYHTDWPIRGVRLDIQPVGAYLSSMNLDRTSQLCYAAIERFLIPKQRLYRRVFVRILIAAILLYAGMALVTTQLTALVTQFAQWSTLIAMAAGAVAGSVFMWFEPKWGGSRIYLEPSSRVSSFWSRNKDKIMIELIKAFLAFLSGVLVTLAVQGLLK